MNEKTALALIRSVFIVMAAITFGLWQHSGYAAAFMTALLLFYVVSK